MIKIGIIGLGYWGPNYLRVFSQIDGCQVAAGSDKDPKRKALFQKNHPSVKFYPDVSGMIAKEALDA